MYMKKLIVFFLIIPLFSCTKDEIKSDEAEILNFSVAPTENFIPSETVIDNENYQIQVFTTNSLSDDKFPVVLVPEIEISQGASITPPSGASISYESVDDLIKYTVVSESGENSVDYYVNIKDLQIPNSDFEDWYEKLGMNGKRFMEPGMHEETTVWATANMGTSSFGVYGTTPLIDGDNTMVQIETGTTEAVPITGGTLFLGKFDINGAIENPTNPEAATDFGIPFVSRPIAIKFKYKYQAGPILIQATLNDPGNIFGGFTTEEITGTDEFSIFAALEKRVDDVVSVIGETEIKSNQTISTMTEMTLTITYSSEDTPTHFYIVFASSSDAAFYKGAIGSTLIIDDLELVYE